MRLRGFLFPSKGPQLFRSGYFALGPRFTWTVHNKARVFNRLNLRNCSHRFHAPQHWNLRLPEHVLDFRFFQPRSVILER